MYFPARVSLVLLLTCGAPAAADESKPKPPPWHLVDIWWDLGADRPLESYAIDVTVHDAIPADVNLYIAPIGLGHLNKTPFYGGIQTQADGYTLQDQRLRKIGRGLLMSMWGQRSPDAVRPAAGGLFQSSGHEGDFVSVRRPYDWETGKYTYRVVRMDKQVVDQQPCTWVGAFLFCHAKNENIFIGALRFPGENLVLSRKIASFVEIYGQAIPVEKIPKATITFGNLSLSGETVANVRATAHYPGDVPQRADATARDGQVVVRVGEPAPAGRKPQAELFPGK
jgi:hypothetical protein